MASIIFKIKVLDRANKDERADSAE